MKALLGIIVIVLIVFICINRYGRDKTLTLAIKILSPVCIILFYLCDVSIIREVIKLLDIQNISILDSESIRVAIDSAIVTLIVNTVLVLLNSPIKVEIEARNSQDMEQVVTYCKKAVKINYSIRINFRYKYLKKIYRKYGQVFLQIKNSPYTSIAIDKEDEYGRILDTNTASKYINIDILNISESSIVEDKLYIILEVVSNKTIKWDSKITTEIVVGNSFLKKFNRLFWQVESSPVRLVHREESI